MAISDDMYKKKMVELEQHKCKALADIRDVGLCIQATLSVLAENAAGTTLTKEDVKGVADYVESVIGGMNKRWEE